MPRFIRRPHVVEARQFETNNVGGDEHMDGLVEWIRSHGGSTSHDRTFIYLAVGGWVKKADVGDWIVRVPEGGFHILDRERFWTEYSPHSGDEG